MKPVLGVPERRFQDQVVKLATVYGWCGFHISFSKGAVTGVHTPRHSDHQDSDGFPDWLFMSERQGRIIFRELKSEKGRLTEAQKRWHRMLTLVGLDCTVWRPSDLEEIGATFRGDVT